MSSNVYQEYVKSRESSDFIHMVKEFLHAELRRYPLYSTEVGGMLRREFGISGKEYKDLKRKIMSQLVKGCDDCLKENDGVVYYVNQEQHDRYHNELL